jgi:hypothetical protein
MEPYNKGWVLMLESVKTETKTSQGYKSPCVFIEAVLLFVLIFSWNSRFLEYRTLQKSIMIIKEA